MRRLRRRGADQTEDRCKERKLRTEAVQYGFAGLRMEGLEPDSVGEDIAKRFMEGELSLEEYHCEMRRLALDITK